MAPGRRQAEYEDDLASPPARDDDFGFDDEVPEDRPRSGKMKGGPKKKRKAKKGGNAGAIVAMIGLALLVVGGIVAAVMFLGGGSADEEMLAYLPGDSDVIVGANVADILENENINAMLDQFGARGPINEFDTKLGQAGLSLKDIERVYFAASSKVGNRGTLVVRSSNPMNAEQVAKAFGGGASREVNGKTLYQADLFGESAYLHAVGENLLVISTLDETAFAQLLDQGASGQSGLSEDVSEMVAEVGDGDVWLTYADSQALQEVGPLLALGAMQYPQLAEVSTALTTGRGAVISMEFSSSTGTLRAGLMCRDSDTASKAVDALEEVIDQIRTQEAGNLSPEDQDNLDAVSFSSSGSFAMLKFSGSLETPAGGLGGNPFADFGGFFGGGGMMGGGGDPFGAPPDNGFPGEGDFGPDFQPGNFGPMGPDFQPGDFGPKGPDFQPGNFGPMGPGFQPGNFGPMGPPDGFPAPGFGNPNFPDGKE